MVMSVFSPPSAQQSFETALVKDSSSVPLARRFLREWYRHWGLPEGVIETGELVASELVTNGLRMKGAGVRVRFRSSLPVAYIEVWDANPNPPVPQVPSLDALGGRGLMLVAACASRWGYYPSDGGKVVWAELAVRPAEGAVGAHASR
ncbi:ATP-binding protein [Actinomadura sp. GTD37]|uniref:ATP-binding protein n=1 Tax=Actinomadura sp. GTD37 TaxID=1778030 RepID=UPI0035BF1318